MSLSRQNQSHQCHESCFCLARVRTCRPLQHVLLPLQDAHHLKQRKVVRSTDGENGFSMEVGPFVSYANRNGVSAVFSGEVSSWPGVDMVQVTHDGAPLPEVRVISLG